MGAEPKSVEPVPAPTPEPAPLPTSLTVRTNQGATVTLGSKQLYYATAIIANARARGFGDAGAKIGLITALVESKLRMYANSNVPESIAKKPDGSYVYEFDAIGNDHNSLNFFQQQTPGWGTVAQLMNMDYAINAFYSGVGKVKDWRTLPPGVVAQKVQVSAFPDRYADWTNAADLLIATFPARGT